jgi:hypothetical protein
MKLARNLVVGAVSALAVSALPFNFDSLALGSVELSSALAKGGNGGGNGNGGGRSGEHGKSGEAHGKSGDAPGRSGGVRAGPESPGGLLKSIFGQETHGAKKKGSADSKVARSTRKSSRALELAALPDSALVPPAKPDQGNLHARLAGLNSLQRNYHAYLNSQSPRFSPIFDYVRDSAEGVLDPDDVALRQALLDAANDNRVAQYGDDYLNDDVMDWSKDVLGVGDADGKIDQVRDTLEVDSQ